MGVGKPAASRVIEHEDRLPPIGYTPPLIAFIKQDAVAAMFLLSAAVLAMAVANSPLAGLYNALLHMPVSVGAGAWHLTQSAHHWVNDGLMVVFFFLVGLEIKRELLVGELASLRRAMLPAVAALGGMLCPALIYTAFNYGSGASRGWGIPMATDIAFAAGCMSLLGRRVSPALTVLLVALAIVDDIGSVLVIAVFYTAELDWAALGTGFGLLGVCYGMNLFGVRRVVPYTTLGVVIWYCFLLSGVHATISGVLIAFTIPINALYRSNFFSRRMQRLLDQFDQVDDLDEPGLVTEYQQVLIRHMRKESAHVEAPLQRLEFDIHPISVYFIMPVFAFFNSGVEIPWSNLGDVVFSNVTLGVFCGLFIGKQLGVTLFSWLAVRVGVAELPRGVTWPQVYGIACVAGIGFTVALFVNNLAFLGAAPAHPDSAQASYAAASAPAVFDAPAHDAQEAEAAHPASSNNTHLAQGKVGIFAASILSGVLGLLVLTGIARQRPKAAPGP